MQWWVKLGWVQNFSLILSQVRLGNLHVDRVGAGEENWTHVQLCSGYALGTWWRQEKNSTSKKDLVTFQEDLWEMKVRWSGVCIRLSEFVAASVNGLSLTQQMHWCFNSQRLINVNKRFFLLFIFFKFEYLLHCLLYTSDAADE